MKKLIIKGLPFLFLAFFARIYSSVDMLMLKYMTDFSVVGWYSAAYRFFDTVNIFIYGIYIPATFPIFSSLHLDKIGTKFTNFLYQSFRVVFTSSLLIVVFIIFYAPFLVHSFFPESFYASALTLRILIFAHIFGTFSVLFNSILLIQNKEKISLYIIMISAILNIFLNLFLISKFSLYGAAWATVIAEAVNLVLLQYFVKWDKKFAFIFKMFLVIFINLILLLILNKLGYLNNLIIGSLVIFSNIIFLYKINLWSKDDLLLFINPFINKINYYKKVKSI